MIELKSCSCPYSNPCSHTCSLPSYCYCCVSKCWRICAAIDDSLSRAPLAVCLSTTAKEKPCVPTLRHYTGSSENEAYCEVEVGQQFNYMAVEPLSCHTCILPLNYMVALN